MEKMRDAKKAQEWAIVGRELRKGVTVFGWFAWLIRLRRIR